MYQNFHSVHHARRSVLDVIFILFLLLYNKSTKYV